jgi:POT family proton-dependent oligopeptide transporter
MMLAVLKSYFPDVSLQKKQTNNIIFITFWSQFAVYALNTVLILFLTRPVLSHGLGYDQTKAYAFIGVAHAAGYLMPVLGGFMADNVLGIRRAILLGSVLLAFAYLLVMLSGFTIGSFGDILFIAAYALVPVSNSLLMGTSSSMVSHIYADDAINTKSAMTYYYMAINVGALLATLIAPSLIDSQFGPLSILTLTFVGKAIAALNFAKNYELYNTVIWGKDQERFDKTSALKLCFYVASIYSFTLFAYTHVILASYILSAGCCCGILWFLGKTIALKNPARIKQLIALLLIIEAVIFFIIYSQMNSTLILFAKSNSNCELLGFMVSPAQYQMLNPLLIILIGSQLPKFYRRFPQFTIPYQFASGTLLSGVALTTMALATLYATDGMINGNYIALTYVLVTIAELWVSAISLSMIGLYCDPKNMAFAMGVMYVASSLSHAISGRVAAWVAIPESVHSAAVRLGYYQSYYLVMGITALGFGVLMVIGAYILQKKMREKGIILA